MAASRVGGYHVRPPTTWQRAPPPHALGNPPAPGEPRCASPPGSTTSNWTHAKHVIPTGGPAGEGPFRMDEMEAGTPGRSPGSSRGREAAALP